MCHVYTKTFNSSISCIALQRESENECKAASMCICINVILQANSSGQLHALKHGWHLSRAVGGVEHSFQTVLCEPPFSSAVRKIKHNVVCCSVPIVTCSVLILQTCSSGQLNALKHGWHLNRAGVVVVTVVEWPNLKIRPSSGCLAIML